MAQTKSFHDFTGKAMDGTDFHLSSLKGKKVLVISPDNGEKYISNNVF